MTRIIRSHDQFHTRLVFISSFMPITKDDTPPAPDCVLAWVRQILLLSIERCTATITQLDCEAFVDAAFYFDDPKAFLLEA